MKRVSSVVVLFLALLVMPVLAFAGSSDLQTTQQEKIVLSSKVPFSFYGFISAETMWGDSQVSSFGTSSAAYNRNITGVTRVVDESLEKNNDAFLDFTVQNTRFGFALDSYDFGGKNFTVDARLEMDFFSTANLSVHSVTPRIRRAYSAIGQEKWRVLFGQEWDVYSPLNTGTLDVGSNMWYQGNQGFRRPQIRFTYNHSFGEKNGLEGVVSVNLAGNSMQLTDAGVTTAIPMEQARVGYWHKLPAGKMNIYLSGFYGRHNNAVAGASKINNWGKSASFEVPIHKYLKPSAEFQYGYSLGSLLSLSSDTTRQRFISGWGQIQSCWLKWFETNIGYGYETLKSSQVAATFVKNNQKGFVNFKFKPVDALVLGLEYNLLRTAYQGTTGTSTANIVLFNTVFFF